MLIEETNCMMPSRSHLPLTLVLLSLAACASPCPAADWPQWRGPQRDDISTETGLLKEWPAGGPALVWKATGLGAGFSGVSTAQGHIFTMGDLGDSSFALALNAEDGKPIWKAPVGKPGGNYAGPRCTPTVDGDRVYVLGQFGDLVCLEAATGKEVWRKSYAKDLSGRGGGWNYTESPLVDGNQVVCTPGGPSGTMAALDKKTGEVIWRTKDFTDNAEYSSIIVAEISGVKQYVQLTGESVVGIAPADGKLLWRAPRKGKTATIPTPICRDNMVYVSSGYGVGCNLFQIVSEGGTFKATEVYANKTMVNHHGGVILIGNYLYGFSDGNGWVCQEFKTGRQVWSDKGVGKGAIAYADGHLYLRSEGGKGTVALIEATPDGYREKGRFDQPDRSSQNSWPHPVIAGGRLYLRDQDVLLCYDVKGK